MSREHLENAIRHHDQQTDELRLVKHELDSMRVENAALKVDLTAASARIQEHEAMLKHIQTVMSVRVVHAAADLAEEISKKVLFDIRDKADDKLKDLFERQAMQAAEDKVEAERDEKIVNLDTERRTIEREDYFNTPEQETVHDEMARPVRAPLSVEINDSPDVYGKKKTFRERMNDRLKNNPLPLVDPFERPPSASISESLSHFLRKSSGVKRNGHSGK